MTLPFMITFITFGGPKDMLPPFRGFGGMAGLPPPWIRQWTFGEDQIIMFRAFEEDHELVTLIRQWPEGYFVIRETEFTIGIYA